MITIEPYEIGRMYRVPTVIYGSHTGRPDAYAVIGPAHEDRKIIGFSQYHYHYDARFLTDRQLASIQWRSRGYNKSVAVFSNVMGWDELKSVHPVVMRLRKCRRVYDEYPAERAVWLPKLEAEHQDAKIDERLICPHRGASLQGLKPASGCVTCPLHGLRWDCKTGELRKRGQAVS